MASIAIGIIAVAAMYRAVQAFCKLQELESRLARLEQSSSSNS